MGNKMQNDKMQALAEELAKGLKTPEDLSNFSAQLTKLTVEAAPVAFVFTNSSSRRPVRTTIGNQ